MIVSFSDEQLQAIMRASRLVQPRLRDAFLKLIAAQLRPRDIDISEAISRALKFVDHDEQDRVA